VQWLAVASVLLALVAGGGSWLLRVPTTPDRAALAMALLQQQALATYAVYAIDRRHPIEVGADQRIICRHGCRNRIIPARTTWGRAA